GWYEVKQFPPLPQKKGAEQNDHPMTAVPLSSQSEVKDQRGGGLPVKVTEEGDKKKQKETHVKLESPKSPKTPVQQTTTTTTPSKLDSSNVKDTSQTKSEEKHSKNKLARMIKYSGQPLVDPNDRWNPYHGPWEYFWKDKQGFERIVNFEKFTD